MTAASKRRERTGEPLDAASFLPLGWWLVFGLSGAASFAYWLLT